MRKLLWLGGLGAAGVLVAGCAVPVGGTGMADPAAVYQLLHGPLSSKQVFDDYTTVDPCSLLDLKSLPGGLDGTRLPAQSLDYCPVQVSYGGHKLEIDVGNVETEDAVYQPDQYGTQSLGRSVTLLKDPDGTEFCDDYLKFADGIVMSVDAYSPDTSDDSGNLCSPVETVAQNVYKTVSTPETVRHRTFPAGSLGKVDTCSLVASADVGTAEAATVHQIAFPAKHQCEWDESSDEDSPHVWVQVIVNKALAPSDPGDTMQTVSGRNSLVSSFSSDDFSTCSVETQQIPYRSTSSTDKDLYEIAEVYADDSSSTATKDCQVATAVATAAWKNLPST